MSPLNRGLLFFFGCIGVRTFLVYLAKEGSRRVQKAVGLFSLAVSVGFMTIWLFNLRETGAEAGGRIWWDELRPIHSLFFGGAAYKLLTGADDGWIYLFLDTILGVYAWFAFKYFIR